MKSNFKTIFAVAWCICVLSMAGLTQSQEMYNQSLDKLQGYWEGDFMEGAGLRMLLAFTKSEEEGVKGRILLEQQGTLIQDDPLSRIKLKGEDLSFVIEAKTTVFKGKLDLQAEKIIGKYSFPDASVHPVVLAKVTKPGFGIFNDENFEFKKYTPDQLSADLDYIKKNLEEYHPQLYLYTTAEEFEQLYSTVTESIEQTVTEQEFFQLIAPIIAKVGCSHTGIRHSDPFEKALQNEPGMLPLDVKFYGEQAFIVHDFSSATNDLSGMQLLSVNNKPVSMIRQELMRSIPADAESKVHKGYKINHGFPFLYANYVETPAVFTLELKDELGEMVQVELQSKDAPYLDSSFRALHADKMPRGNLPLSLEIDKQHGVAILKVFAFFAPDERLYHEFLTDIFKKFRQQNIEYLILDLRGNEGGHPLFAAELLSFLADSSFAYLELPSEQEEMKMLYKPVQPSPEAFKGNLYVLMDGGCLSTCGHFLSLVKYHSLGSLIGEESGSSFYCNDGSILLKLPNTGIQFNLPRVTYQTAVRGFEKGEPLKPDHAVSNSLQDDIQGRDAAMEYVRSLIKARK